MTSILSLDHLVLTVADIDATVAFYSKLGMTAATFHPAAGTSRTALKFGNHKINLHLAGAEFEPKAHRATPGSADLCFLVTSDPTDTLNAYGIQIIDGPVTRTGATGPITSIYIRDPDGNLVELGVVI